MRVSPQKKTVLLKFLWKKRELFLSRKLHRHGHIYIYRKDGSGRLGQKCVRSCTKKKSFSHIPQNTSVEFQRKVPKRDETRIEQTAFNGLFSVRNSYTRVPVWGKYKRTNCKSATRHCPNWVFRSKSHLFLHFSCPRNPQHGEI